MGRKVNALGALMPSVDCNEKSKKIDIGYPHSYYKSEVRKAVASLFRNIGYITNNILGGNSVNEFDLNKAQFIIEYLVTNTKYVEDGDLMPEEIAEYLIQDHSVEDIATNILKHVGEENSRFEYDDDILYALTKIIRKRAAIESKSPEQMSLAEKKASLIIKYLEENCEEVEEGDVIIDDIVKILEQNLTVDDRAAAIFDFVAKDNSRFKYNDDDSYEIARIVRKKRL